MARKGWHLTEWVTHRQQPLPSSELERLDADAQRLRAGEPLAYVLGTAPFRELLLRVSPAVLIPRPETEELIDHALDYLAGLRPTTPLRILDLGTGCGALALGLASALRDAAAPTATIGSMKIRSTTIIGVDASAEALAIARQNAAQTGLEVSFLQSNWLESVTGRCHLILSNPPYLAASDPHLADLGDEPAAALVAGPTGLEDLQQIIATAPAALETDGALMLEHGSLQGADCRTALVEAGFAEVATLTDSYGLPRFSTGVWQR